MLPYGLKAFITCYLFRPIKCTFIVPSRDILVSVIYYELPSFKQAILHIDFPTGFHFTCTCTCTCIFSLK